jgi:fatty-acyl-CoA synthase
LSPHTVAKRLAAAGAPLLSVRLRTDEHGQVLARTAKGMSGYWNRPDLSDEAFRDGMFVTGDGREPSDGTLRITDRKKDVIVTGGENVSSIQVESVLYGHPDVVEAAVIGVSHDRWGETVKALVLLREGVALDELALIAPCKERMAASRAPRRSSSATSSRARPRARSRSSACASRTGASGPPRLAPQASRTPPSATICEPVR